MIHSYPEALKVLYDNLPMFQRVGAAAVKKDLANTLRLCALLGHPEKAFRSVHVAGTNGKGSTCHMLASVLQSAGYKTGLYTSPHLKDFTERIRINGTPVPPAYVVDFVNRMLPAMEDIRPSFFEVTVCMAFAYFAAEEVDVAVIEVGLGGRLDSTNVITPLLSVITNISWDHMDLLGDSLPAIAAEKAGIIKKGVPVVISERQPEVAEVFIEKAASEDAALFFAPDLFRAVPDGSGAFNIEKEDKPFLSQVRLPLRGIYQRHNVQAVLAALQVLRSELPVSAEAIRAGLENVTSNTGLKGRWQQLASSPTVICDTAHNAEGIRLVVEQIMTLPFRRLFIVWGMVKDKDVAGILRLLPADAAYVFCQAPIPRALDASTLHEEASRLGLKGEVVRDVNEAIQTALGKAGGDDLVFIGGSTYVVAEVDNL